MKPIIRWPIIRHIRALWLAYQVARWEEHWRAMGFIPTGRDQEHLRNIWRGEA